MKKILLITFLGTLFAAGSAFAHCGACGSDAAHKADKAECKSECMAECKAECAKDKAKKCCGSSECAKDKAACTKDKAEGNADDTAAKPAPCCAGKMAPKPA